MAPSIRRVQYPVLQPMMDDVTGRYTGGGGGPNPFLSGRPSTRLTLHLGVIDQPYRTAGKKGGATTTGNVASILEAKYDLMQTFAHVHWSTIETALTVSIQNALEAVIMGRRVDPWDRGAQHIQADFRKFISSFEAERVGIPGTPTKAALRGVNHRLKHPYRKSNPRRPSFRDTGLYMASFRAWVD